MTEQAVQQVEGADSPGSRGAHDDGAAPALAQTFTFRLEGARRRPPRPQGQEQGEPTETALHVPPPSQPKLTPIRVARFLALAHSVEQLIAAGTYRDHSDAARALGVTKARLTQLTNLTLLAPQIQEQILFKGTNGKFQAVNERALRWVARTAGWEEQRKRWKEVDTTGDSRK